MHVQVVNEEAPVLRVQTLTETSSDNVVTDGFTAAALASDDVDHSLLSAPEDEVRKPIVKDASDWSNTPRNAPCPCNSGKKFKMCHGAAA
jgi:preprotein translocase subunit SecA